MDKTKAGLLGAVATLATLGVAHAATSAAVNPADALQAASYSDLLAPVQNAVAVMKADDAARARKQEQRQAEGDVQLAQYLLRTRLSPSPPSSSPRLLPALPPPPPPSPQRLHRRPRCRRRDRPLTLVPLHTSPASRERSAPPLGLDPGAGAPPPSWQALCLPSTTSRHERSRGWRGQWSGQARPHGHAVTMNARLRPYAGTYGRYPSLALARAARRICRYVPSNTVLVDDVHVVAFASVSRLA